MARGHIIPFKEGVLEPKHVEAIGPAFWEFVWMINKVTKEVDGIGLVLGGQPVRFSDVSKKTGRSIDRTKDNIHRLISKGYLGAKRTPYGVIYTVNKSAKFIRREKGNAPDLDKGNTPSLEEGYTPDPEKGNAPSLEARERGNAPSPERGFTPQRKGIYTAEKGDLHPLQLRDSGYSGDSSTRGQKASAANGSAKVHPKDDAFEQFAEAYYEHTGVPIDRDEKGPFTWLAKLRKRLGIGGKETPEGWTLAIRNYFDSDFAKKTLPHLCRDYEVFIRGPVDRFNKLVTRKSRVATAADKESYVP